MARGPTLRGVSGIVLACPTFVAVVIGTSLESDRIGLGLLCRSALLIKGSFVVVTYRWDTVRKARVARQVHHRNLCKKRLLR